MMTQETFQAVAEVLAGEYAVHTTDTERLVVRNIALSIADKFAQSNKNFDRALFYKVVGLDATVLSDHKFASDKVYDVYYTPTSDVEQFVGVMNSYDAATLYRNANDLGFADRYGFFEHGTRKIDI